MSINSFEQLRKRKLFQWSVAYLAAAWALLQVLDLIGENFGWPSSIVRMATVAGAAGFFVTLILAWNHGEHGRQRVNALEVVLITIAVAAGITGATIVNRTAEEPTGSKTEVLDTNTIAVLPFVNRSADPDNEYFSDGISEELMAALVGIPGLQVRARTSSFAFKGKSVPMHEIARQLRVAHLVEGSVQRAGGRVRITARLIDVSNDRQLWAERYDRELKDVFAVEAEISQAIAEALRFRLGTIVLQGTTNPEAHEQHLRGRYMLTRGSEEAIGKSLEYFERAIALDPDYAAAHAGLAEALLLSTPFKPSPTQMERARRSAHRALELDPDRADAYAVLGAILLWHDRDMAGSERALRRSLALNPGGGNARDYYAWVQMLRGEKEAAMRTAKEAVRMDPLSASLSYALEFRYVQLRDYHSVIAQQRVTAELDPAHFFWDLPVGIAYRELGEYDKSVAEYQRIEQILHGRPLHGLAITYARMGRSADARHILARLEERAKVGYTPPEQIALIYANLGDNDTAMKWLDRALDTKSGWLLGWAQLDPSYDPLRSDVRFQNLLRRLDLGL